MKELKNLSVILLVANCVLQLQGLYSFGQLSLIVFVVWFVITLFAYGNAITKVLSEPRFIALYVFVLFNFISTLLIESVSISFNRSIALLNVLSPVLMYEVVRLHSFRFQRFFLILVLITIVLNIFQSYNFISAIGAVNLRQSFRDYGSEYYIINIVFNLCYSFAIAIPCLMELMKKVRIKRGISFLIILLSAIILFYLIKAQYVTAVILAFGLGIFFLFYKNKKSIYITTAVLAFVLVAFVNIYPSISSQLDRSEGYSELTSRLDEIYMALTGQGSNATDLNSRTNLSMLSMETFIHNPILGVNHIISSDVHIIDYGIGNHASWPDSLARYGLFSLLLFSFLWQSLKKQRKELGILAPSLAFAVLGFLNPVLHFPQICTVFLIMPIMYNYTKHNEKRMVVSKEICKQ